MTTVVVMNDGACFWCGSHDVATTDPDGDGCCDRCVPLLDPDGCCGYCGDGHPIKMVGQWPSCVGCLNAFHEAGMLARRPGRPRAYELVDPNRHQTTKERIEAIAREAGIKGSGFWDWTVQNFMTAVSESRCLKLGLVKTRSRDDAGLLLQGALRGIANDE